MSPRPVRTILRAGAMVLLGLVLLGRGDAAAANDAREELARALAAFMLDENARRGLDEQVTAGMIRSIGTTLQERLHRQLLEVEWRIVGDIVRRFVSEAMPSSHAQEIAARVYARNFEETELRELLRFQQSPVGQKAARLAPAIQTETSRAIDIELRESPAVPAMVVELQRQFPILKNPESP
jgi:hypothetical protein